LWEDYDFDFSHLFKLMAFKMNSMASYFEKHGVGHAAKSSALEMRKSAALLDRALGYRYTEDLDSRLDALLGHAELIVDDCGLVSIERCCDPKEMAPYFTLNFIYVNRARSHADIYKALSIIASNYEDWWD
jgi:hypothetical protein